MVWYGFTAWTLGLFACRQDSRVTTDPWSRATVNPEHQDPEALDGKINAVYMVFI